MARIKKLNNSEPPIITVQPTVMQELGFDDFGERSSVIEVEAEVTDAQQVFPDLSLEDPKIGTLSVSKLISGTVESQQISLDVVGGEGDVYLKAGTVDTSAWTATSGFILGIDDSDSDKVKFFLGTSGNSIDWNVTSANTLTVKGSLVAGEIHIPDEDTTANSFHVENDGDTFWGCTQSDFTSDNDNATAYVLKTGVAKFQNVTVSGGTIEAGTDIGSTDAANVEGRANAAFTEVLFIGNVNDGFTETGTTITRNTLFTNIVSTTQTSINSPNIGASLIIDWDSMMEFTIVLQDITSDPDPYEIFCGLTDTSIICNASGLTRRHIGFWIEDGVLYATNANGTTQSATDISSGLTLSDWNKFRVVLDPGTSVKFYVGDVLKATHTTNVPSGTTTPPEIWIGGDDGVGSAGQPNFNFCNNYTVKAVL